MPDKSKDNKSSWEMNSIVGTVVESRIYSETNVAASGGGGYVTKWGGTIEPIQISSTSNECQSIVIATAMGDELTVNIGEPCISIRKGHRLHVVLGKSLGAKNSKHKALYIRNLDTNETAQYDYPESRPDAKSDAGAALFVAGLLWFITVILVAILIGLLFSKVPSSLESPLLLGAVGLFIFYVYLVNASSEKVYKKNCETESILIDEAIAAAQSGIQKMLEQSAEDSPATSVTRSEQRAQVSVCPSCTKQDTSNSKFCGDCGTALLQFDVQV